MTKPRFACQLCQLGADTLEHFSEHMRLFHGVAISPQDIRGGYTCVCSKPRWWHDRQRDHEFQEATDAD